MAFNIAGTGLADRRRLEEIVQIQAPAVVAAKSPDPKPPKAETPPVKPVEVLTKSEKKLVLDKFKPMPPLLEKALNGVRVVRQGLEEINRLAVLPGNQALPVAVNGPGERAEIPARVQNAAAIPTGPENIGKSPLKTGSNQPAPIQNSGQPPLAAAGTMPENKPAAIPREEGYKTVPPQMAPAERGPAPVKTQGQTAFPQPVERQAVNVLRNVAAPTPPAQEPALRPAGNTTITGTPATALPVAELIQNQVIQEVVIPPPSFMVPVPTVPSTRSSQAGDASVAQSKILNGLPMVIPVSHPTTRTAWDQSQDNIVQVLLEQLRQGSIAEMATEARHAVQIFQVQPLTNPLEEDQTQANQFFTLLTGTNNNRLQELTGLNVLAIETVARTPPSDDNMARVRAGEELNPPVAKPDNNIGPFGTSPDDGRNNTPPLANIRPPERPLPTNMRSRLVMVQTVNLLDMVL